MHRAHPVFLIFQEAPDRWLVKPHPPSDGCISTKYPEDRTPAPPPSLTGHGQWHSNLRAPPRRPPLPVSPPSPWMGPEPTPSLPGPSWLQQPSPDLSSPPLEDRWGGGGDAACGGRPSAASWAGCPRAPCPLRAPSAWPALRGLAWGPPPGRRFCARQAAPRAGRGVRPGRTQHILCDILGTFLNTPACFL